MLQHHLTVQDLLLCGPVDTGFDMVNTTGLGQAASCRSVGRLQLQHWGALQGLLDRHSTRTVQRHLQLQAAGLKQL